MSASTQAAPEMESRQTELIEAPNCEDLAWQASGIASGEVSLDGETHEFVELLSTADLWMESRTLRHCVVTYAYLCRGGGVVIFSMRRAGERLVTIEVEMQRRRIVQARGYANRPPTTREWEAIAAWAAREGMTISPDA